MSKVEKYQVPKIRFEGFSGNWMKDSLVELTDKIGDGIHATPIYSEEGEVPFINGNNLVNNVITITENTKKISYAELAKYNQYLNSRSLLMSINGTIGNTAFYNNETVLLGKSICYINVSDILNINYCFYYLSSPKIVKDIEVSLTGSTIRNLSLKTIRNLEVNFPGFSEQTHIGNLFQQLDKLIDLQTRAVESAETYKKAMLQKMFPQKGEKVPRVRFEGFSGDWEKYKLQDLGDIVTGSTPSTSNQSNYSDDGLLWVTPSDIKSIITEDTVRKLSEEGQKIARIIPANSILVTCIASIGKNTLVKTKVSCNQQINALIPNTAAFEVYFLLTNSFYWSQVMKNHASSGMMQLVNKTDFSLIETLIPCLEEQTQIGNFFQKLDQNIESEKKKLEQYQTMKRAMLQRMFV